MKSKYILNSLKIKYNKIPAKLFQTSLPSHAISIYCYMASCAEEFNPSVRNIAKSLTISPPTVLKYINKLLDRNIITKFQQGGSNRFTIYEFIDPKNWK